MENDASLMVPDESQQPVPAGKVKTGKKKEITFPFEVKRGSVTVKIYRTPSHGCESFTLSYYQDGARKRPTFPDFASAKAEADAVVGRLASTEADVLTLTSADRAAYLRARQLLDPLGIAIETAAAQIAESRRLLGDTPLLTVVADHVKRHPVKLELKPVQVVVDELLAVKKADGASGRYLQSLRWALGKFARRFHVNISSLQVLILMSGYGIRGCRRGREIICATRSRRCSVLPKRGGIWQRTMMNWRRCRC